MAFSADKEDKNEILLRHNHQLSNKANGDSRLVSFDFWKVSIMLKCGEKRLERWKMEEIRRNGQIK